MAVGSVSLNKGDGELTVVLGVLFAVQSFNAYETDHGWSILFDDHCSTTTILVQA